jgi:sRNA-binding regulator protein Hfq
MKETMDAASARVTDDQDNFANRKLIRPALPRVDHNHGNQNSNHNSNHGPNHNSNRNSGHMQGAERAPRHERPERAQDHRGGDRGDHRPAGGGGGGRKVVPPEQTNAENFYYQKQMQSRTPMVIVLRDGEEIHGIIEWYDKTCIKLNRSGDSNLLVYKSSIRYMFKEAEEVKK